MRSAGLWPHPYRGWTPSSSKGWTRAARYWLVFIACLAQLWVPAQHRHAPFAAHTIVASSGAAGAALSSIGAGKSDLRCSLSGAVSNSHDGGTPAPCQNDNCPCCPLMHSVIGVLPQEAGRVVYAPLLSATVAQPALFCPLTRFASFAGQPRAPPILI